jgi:hypothetical protein
MGYHSGEAFLDCKRRFKNLPDRHSSSGAILSKRADYLSSNDRNMITES